MEEMHATQEGRPLYQQVKSAISSGLMDGTWKPGDKLPTETELSRKFGVSEGTVRQAVIALVKEGKLTRRSGKGTFATRPNFTRSFARFFRFRGPRNSQEPQYGVHVIKLIENASVNGSIRQKLALKPGSPILAIHRVIEQDRVVVCYSISYLSQERFGALTRNQLEGAALYEALQEQHGVHVLRAVETLQARGARADEAKMLDIRRGEPVIAIERLAYTHRDHVVEVRHAVGRSDIFSYQIELS
jgi:GntR family transcriptional regulator